ncbi:MAG TPA: hypothetical protein VFN57_17700, partial [Thermomicrobiaceae bacterium]|nr:hypothetical protein [Thermomicrobiaceae bacterium]
MQTFEGARPDPRRPSITLLLGGMGTSLSSEEAASGWIGPFAAHDRLLPYLRGRGWRGTAALFSYRGAAVDGAGEVRPFPYATADTFSRGVAEGVTRLAEQLALYLAARPGATVYLIGHSLGGVIAYGYLARLAEAGDWTLPEAGRLAAVVTLDAPLGGVFGDAPVQFTLVKAYLALLHRRRLLRPFDELVGLWRTAAGREPFGAFARLASLVDGGRRPTNQRVAREAREHGVRLLTVGSRHDRAFAPGMHVRPFPSVQWLADGGMGSGIYGRVVEHAPDGSRVPHPVESHGAVLHDPRVHEAVWHFLLGRDPAPL